MVRVTQSEVPGTILPVQFFTQTALLNTPEKRLIFAVMLDAIVQLRHGDADAAVDAERWIRGETEGAPISFPLACDALGIEARGFARRLFAERAPPGVARGVRGRALPQRAAARG